MLPLTRCRRKPSASKLAALYESARRGALRTSPARALVERKNGITTQTSCRSNARTAQPQRGICLMDKWTSGMDMWTRLCLAHIPTPTDHLPTGGRLRPDALRLPYVYKNSPKYGYQDLSPLAMLDGGGLRMGIASPYRDRTQFGCYPLDAGRSQGVVRGQKASSSPLQPCS